jgi:hypothetical protein
MSDENRHVDETLRDAFPVDAEVAAQVVGRALAPPRRAKRVRVTAPFALAAAACAVGLAVWLSRPAIAPAPAHDRTAVADLSGSFVDGILIVAIPGDGTLITGPERRDARPSDGTGIVMVEGEGR